MQEAPTIDNYEDIGVHLSTFIKNDDNVAILLDYDGTLAPLPPLTVHPALAVIEPDSENALKKLSTQSNVFLAIISGRAVDDVKEKVPINNLTYGGNHGLEILYPNGTRFEYEVSAEMKSNFAKMIVELEQKVAKQGAWIQNKLVSLSYHYRDVPEELQQELSADARKIIQSFGYVDCQAHLAIDAKPTAHWNKGEAALLILKDRFGDDWPTRVKVLFAGDDTSDEDAMRALKGKGITFRVSASPQIKTYADYRVPSTKTVSYLLRWLADRL